MGFPTFITRALLGFCIFTPSKVLGGSMSLEDDTQSALDDSITSSNVVVVYKDFPSLYLKKQQIDDWKRLNATTPTSERQLIEIGSVPLPPDFIYPITTPFRMDCGKTKGDPYIDPVTGITWMNDQYNSAGTIVDYCGARQKPNFGTNHPVVNGIYCDVRNARLLEYNIPVIRNQQYMISLHFIELILKQKNRRVIDIEIENVTVKSGLDYYGEFGYLKPTILTFGPLQSYDDNNLHLLLRPIQSARPFLSAIEINTYGEDVTMAPITLSPAVFAPVSPTDVPPVVVPTTPTLLPPAPTTPAVLVPPAPTNIVVVVPKPTNPPKTMNPRPAKVSKPIRAMNPRAPIQTTLSPTLSPLDLTLNSYINAGTLANNWTDSADAEWMTDRYYDKSATIIDSTHCPGGNKNDLLPSKFQNHMMYCSFRSGREIIYEIPLPVDTRDPSNIIKFKVTVDFLELIMTEMNARPMNVYIEGIMVAEKYDTLDFANGVLYKPTTLLIQNVFDVNEDGVLTIRLESANSDNPCIVNGLRIQDMETASDTRTSAPIASTAPSIAAVAPSPSPIAATIVVPEKLAHLLPSGTTAPPFLSAPAPVTVRIGTKDRTMPPIRQNTPEAAAAVIAAVWNKYLGGGGGGGAGEGITTTTEAPSKQQPPTQAPVTNKNQPVSEPTKVPLPRR